MSLIKITTVLLGLVQLLIQDVTHLRMANASSAHSATTLTKTESASLCLPLAEIMTPARKLVPAATLDTASTKISNARKVRQPSSTPGVLNFRMGYV